MRLAEALQEMFQNMGQGIDLPGFEGLGEKVRAYASEMEESFNKLMNIEDFYEKFYNV